MSTGDTALLWFAVAMQSVVLYLSFQAYSQMNRLKKEIDTLREMRKEKEQRDRET